MKIKLIPWLFVTLLICLLVTLPAQAQSRLAIISITPSSSPMITGQAVIFTVSYQNQGDVAWPVENPISLTLELAKDSYQSTCQAEIPVTQPITPTTTLVYSVNACPLTPLAAGDYVLTATLNDGPKLQQTLTVVESALPKELSQLIAGLGMFAAVMAIMAAGTEVAIDMLRVLLGMKSKVTALDTLKDLQDKIPGKLAAVGVSAADIQLFRDKADRLRWGAEPAAAAVENIRNGRFGQIVFDIVAKQLVTMLAEDMKKRTADEQALQNTELWKLVGGVESPSRLASDLARSMASGMQAGIKNASDLIRHALAQPSAFDLPKALKGFEDAFPLAANAQDLKTAVTEELTLALKNFGDRFNDELQLKVNEAGKFLRLHQAVINVIKAGIKSLCTTEIKNVDTERVLEVLFTGLQNLLTPQGREIAVKWVETSANDLVGQGAAYVLAEFDQKLKPFLQDIGVADTYIDGTLRQTLNEGLVAAGAEAKQASQAYVDGVKQLLTAVEKRRNLVQSPLRKIWRIVRNSSANLACFVIGIVLLVLALSWPLGSLRWLTVFSVAFFLASATASYWLEGLIKWCAKVTTGWYPGDNPDDPMLPAQKRRRLKALRLLFDGKRPQVITDEVGVTLADLCQWIFDATLPPFPRLVPGVKVRRTQTTMFVVLTLKQLPNGIGILLRWLIIHLSLPSIGQVFGLLETVWNHFLRRENDKGNVADSILQSIDKLDTTNLAAILVERDDQHQDEESTRLRWLRVLAVVIGTALAVALSVDTAKLLEAAVPGIATVINVFSVDVGLFVAQRLLRLNAEAAIMYTGKYLLTPGTILTGLAASAGSAFWHDQLDRLQVLKKGAETTAQMLQQPKKAVEQ